MFADTFYEANGVGTLSRQLAQFARERNFPFLAVIGGAETAFRQDSSVSLLSLRRSWASFPLDKNLEFDPFFSRHKELVIRHLEDFKPDLIHITGPGDVGFLGLLVSHVQRIPLMASWHTNLHEYVARRLDRALRLLPSSPRGKVTAFAQKESLRGLLRFYRTAKFVAAPNLAMVDLLRERINRPAYLMRHGVDLSAYSPRLTPRQSSKPFCIGYVGRLTSEKNVSAFADLEKKLDAAGERHYRLLLVGEGGQEGWLRSNLRHAEFSGVLRGADLANAYREMDVFVFPSTTDTFGLVLLEAMASGIPVIATSKTGAGAGIQDGISGILGADFPSAVLRLMHDADLRAKMGQAALAVAEQQTWQWAFEQLYETYAEGLQSLGLMREPKAVLPGSL